MRNKNDKIEKLLIRVDYDGVNAIKKDAESLLNKVNNLYNLSKIIGNVEIENVVDIVPKINNLLESKFSDGVIHRSAALLLGMEAEYIKLVKDSEELLSTHRYKMYARFLKFNSKSKEFVLKEMELDMYATQQSSIYIYGEKAISMYHQTNKLIDDFLALLEMSVFSDGLKERKRFSSAINLVNIDSSFKLTANDRLIVELTK